jgi:hypothetical protein
VPLPQDDVVIPNAFVAGRSVVVDMVRPCRSLTCTCTGNPALNVASGATITLYGSLTLAAGMTISAASQVIDFGARSPATLTNAGVVWPHAFTLSTLFGGKLTLQDAYTATAGTQINTHAMGELDLNGFTMTVGRRYNATTSAATLTFGSGSLILGGTDTTPLILAAGMTINPGTGTIKVPNTTAIRTATMPAGLNYPSLWLAGGSSAGLDLALSTSGTGTFPQVKIDAGLSVRFTAARTYSSPDWQIGGGCTIGSITAASHTLEKTGGGYVSVAGATISRSSATPANAFLAGAGSVDGGNNTGWKFLQPITADADQFDDADQFAAAATLAIMAAAGITEDGDQLSATATVLAPLVEDPRYVAVREKRSFTAVATGRRFGDEP